MPIYEYGEQNGTAYLVMPHLTGGNLRDLLKSRGTLPFEQTLAYIEQVSSALDYAHGHKVIHRDIKPANLIFHADGRLVLADFGIARMLISDGYATEATLTSPGQLIGSVEYMAPEMVQGEYTDHRTDIYELGIVLFQMVSGQVPFQGTSPLMVAAKHVQEPPPLLHEINPAISPALDAVIHKALAKKREDRYMSAGELARSLRDAIVSPRSVLLSNVSQTPVAVSQSALTLETPQHPAPAQMQVQPADNASAPVYAQDMLYKSAHTQPKSLPLWLGFIAVFFVLLLVGGVVLFGERLLGGVGKQPSPNALPTARVTHAPTPVPTPTMTPVQQAQSVVNRYYNDINQHNYSAAYQLWGADYHTKDPYDHFAAGFQHTTHDDIKVQGATLQSDGTVIVEIMLYATEESSSGPIFKAFQGSYTVGTEYGVWKLLTANLQLVATG
jgi:serine/threonine-protein kinase